MLCITRIRRVFFFHIRAKLTNAASITASEAACSDDRTIGPRQARAIACNPKAAVTERLSYHKLGCYKWCPQTESNRGPIDYKSVGIFTGII
jgi:hypothetical protein